MRKIIPLIVVLAAIAVLWSKSISSRAQTVTPVEQTQTPATLSPLELMSTRSSRTEERSGGERQGCGSVTPSAGAPGFRVP